MIVFPNEFKYSISEDTSSSKSVSHLIHIFISELLAIVSVAPFKTSISVPFVFINKTSGDKSKLSTVTTSTDSLALPIVLSIEPFD